MLGSLIASAPPEPPQAVRARRGAATAGGVGGGGRLFDGARAEIGDGGDVDFHDLNLDASHRRVASPSQSLPE